MTYKEKTFLLFIDDERFPYVKNPKLNDVSAYHYTNYEPFKTKKWVIVRSYNEFIDKIEELGLPQICSFDNDLGDVGVDEKTGYDCAKWLCTYCQTNGLKFPDYHVHSMNPIGKVNIISYIENYKKFVELK